MNFNTLMHSLERKLIEPIITKKYSAESSTIKLEDLHANSSLVLKNWCKIYGIKYNKVLIYYFP